MKSFFILLLLFASLMIIAKSGKNRLVWLIGSLFVLNDKIFIGPFSSYSILCTAFVFSLFYHNELKKQWNIFHFQIIFIILFLLHIMVMIMDDRGFPLISCISRVYNNFVPRYLALFVGFAAIKEISEFNRMLKPVSLIILLVSIYGCFTFVLQDNPYIELITSSFESENIWRDVQERGYRVYSTLNSPIVYGYVMCIATHIVMMCNGIYHKKTLLIIAFLAFINIFLANSRTGVVSGFLLISLFIILKNGISVSFLKYLSVAFFVGLLSYLYIPAIQTSIDSAVDIFLTGGENTGGSNMDLKDRQFEASFLLFIQHPFWGNGFNYFQEEILNKESVLLSDLAGLEGFAYKLLIEEGGFMIAAVVLLFTALIWIFYKRIKFSPYSSVGIAWTLSFLFFICATGTYGGIFTIGMVFIGIILKRTYLDEVFNFNTRL